MTVQSRILSLATIVAAATAITAGAASVMPQTAAAAPVGPYAYCSQPSTPGSSIDVYVKDSTARIYSTLR